MPDSNVRWLVAQRTPLPFTFVHGQVTLLDFKAAKVVPTFWRNPPSWPSPWEVVENLGTRDRKAVSLCCKSFPRRWESI